MYFSALAGGKEGRWSSTSPDRAPISLWAWVAARSSDVSKYACRLPFSGRGGREIGGWIQFREPTDCLTEEWLVALADAWPTPVLSMLSAPAAASTVTWEMGFVHLDRQTCTENDWWAYRSEAAGAENGYVHEQGAIWDPEGRLAAYSRQTSTVFA